MRKFTYLLCVISLFVLCVVAVTSCGTNPKDSVNKDAIEQVVTHIEANELSYALSKCQSLNQKSLESGKDKILEIVLIKLKYYLDSDNWIVTNYSLVEEKAIEELKIYQQILNTLPLEDTFTNATTFVSTALKLEEFIEWNEYYKSQDDYLEEAIDYLNQGSSYRNTSWSTAVKYYEKAFNVTNTAYNHYKDSNERGMQEAAQWYKVLSEQIRRTINKEESSSAQENAYTQASESYQNMLNDYSSMLSEVVDILELFPSKLY